MAQYSLNDIDLVIGKANTTLYKLRQMSDEDMLMRGDRSLRMQLLLISIIKDAVEWEVKNNFADPKTHGLVAYLNHKVSGYSFDATSAYYAVPTTPQGGAQNGAPQSGYQFFKQMVVGVDAGAPADQATNYTNSNLIGRYVTVVLDGQILASGLPDRQSIIYNMNTGSIDFTAPLNTLSVIQIFTYIPNLAGWIKVADFTVTNAFNTYTNAAIVGKSVAIVVDGVILPYDLPGRLSYTYSPFTGVANFSEIINPSQSFQIYIY